MSAVECLFVAADGTTSRVEVELQADVWITREYPTSAHIDDFRYFDRPSTRQGVDHFFHRRNRIYPLDHHGPYQSHFEVYPDGRRPPYDLIPLSPPSTHGCIVEYIYVEKYCDLPHP